MQYKADTGHSRPPGCGVRSRGCDKDPTSVRRCKVEACMCGCAAQTRAPGGSDRDYVPRSGSESSSTRDARSQKRRPRRERRLQRESRCAGADRVSKQQPRREAHAPGSLNIVAQAHRRRAYALGDPQALGAGLRPVGRSQVASRGSAVGSNQRRQPVGVARRLADRGFRRRRSKRLDRVAARLAHAAGRLI